jgi:hypothetical protein
VAAGAAPRLRTNPKTKTALVAGLPEEKALALGEQMYRKGILPNGEPMQAVVSSDVPVAGTSFSCISCHLRGGLGSWEGGIVTLPANGARLAQTRYWKFPNLSPEERKGLSLKVTPPARPPYTDEALAHVLRTGIDPGGRELHYAMPRYNLGDQDMAILIHYLRNLSVEPSPGADATTIRFATVITDEVSAEDERDMLVPMNNFITMHNRLPMGFGNRGYYSVDGDEGIGSYRKLALSVWKLKGAPKTWAAQLDAYMAKDPVFALVGGLTYGEWKPIHTYCESRKLPCLLPLTDLPVVSDTDWYTQYFSKGYYQEGQAAARFLRSQKDPAAVGSILQITQDGPEGRDLASGFRETWLELEGSGVKEVQLKKGDSLTSAALQALLLKEKPTTVICWTGPGSLPALEGIGRPAGHPDMVFMSSRLLGAKVYALPETARSFTWLTYPYRDPKEEPEVSKYAESLMAGMKERHPATRIATRTFSLLQVLNQGLIDLNRFFYRDNFMDRISMQRDQILPDFLRLSFGPGQRYSSKGCYIMQLSPGPEGQLVRKSEWVIH